MTPAAQRKQRERDRRKAGLVLVQAWVPAEKAEEIRQAIEKVVDNSALDTTA